MRDPSINTLSDLIYKVELNKTHQGAFIPVTMFLVCSLTSFGVSLKEA